MAGEGRNGWPSSMWRCEKVTKFDACGEDDGATVHVIKKTELQCMS